MKSVGIIMMIVAGVILLLCLLAILIINLLDDGSIIGRIFKIVFFLFVYGARQLAIIGVIVLMVGLGLTIYGIMV